MPISDVQKEYIRFYMGDEEVVNHPGFFGGNQAYNTINAFLAEDIHDEIDKIKEGRVLGIENGAHVRFYLDLILQIVLAMRIFYQENTNEHLITYKVDRLGSINNMRTYKKLEGFYSTCKYGYLPQYAKMKADVVLLEIHRQRDVPYLDFEVLFGQQYAKKEEAEILLPFDTRIERIEEATLSLEEREQYRDMHGNVPCGKWILYVKKAEYASCEDLSSLYQWLVCSENIEKVKNCFMHMHQHDDMEYSDYIHWKRQLHRYLEGRIVNEE